MEKKPNLDFSRQFDVFWWSTLPEIKGSADFICKKIPDDELGKFKLRRLKNHLKVILTNLYVARRYNPKLYVAISMDKNKYFMSHRYPNLYLNYRYVTNLICLLRDYGYLEFHTGIRYDNYGRVSRMKGTSKLYRLFKKYRREGGIVFRRQPPVILRDSNKKNIDFDINIPKIKNIVQNVNKINKCLMRHKVEAILPAGWCDEIRKEFDAEMRKYEGCTKYHRAFNDSSFDLGGRFYGHWSQSIKKNYRGCILIDGEGTVELDYSCLHIFMLYCLEGIATPDGDLYALTGIDKGHRKLIKRAVNMAINADDERSAMQAIHHYIIKDIGGYKTLPYGLTPKIIINAIKETHSDISKYICSGFGKRLQNLDSEIAEKILLNFASRDICCLSVHDSFIIGKCHRDELKSLMERYFREMFNCSASYLI